MPDNWIIPDWPAPPGVRAVFTTRAGGVSPAPWDSFNLGDHVGDAPAAVAANRAALRQSIGARPVFLQQVHGTQVAQLDAATPDATVADAAVTIQRGLACTVMVADCLPVLLTDASGRRVAAAHAGWRGLASGVLQSTLQSFCDFPRALIEEFAINREANDIIAWLGPCIGPRAFEVGAEVREAFIASDAGAAACFAPQGAGKYLADLPALARRRLGACGVARVYGNDGGDAWCTVAQPERFYSYRRDQATRGGSGRMAACIWLD